MKKDLPSVILPTQVQVECLEEKLFMKVKKKRILKPPDHILKVHNFKLENVKQNKMKLKFKKKILYKKL